MSLQYEVEIVADQVFSHVQGAPRLADIYLPKNAPTPLPVILWLHGGGWRLGDRKLGPDLKRFFAERGFAMVSIDYRLSGEAIFPAAIVDVKTAVRWVRSVAQQFHLDPERIGLWGSSSGGHLAACAALSGELFRSDEHAQFSDEVQAVADGYGPTDFSRMKEGRPEIERSLDPESLAVQRKMLERPGDSFEDMFLGSPVATSPEKVQQANPASYVRPGAPPFLILHGLSDALVPWTQSRILFDALANAGNPATLVLFEKLSHGFLNNSDLAQVNHGAVTQDSTSAMRDTVFLNQESIFGMVEDFFRRTLGVPPATP